MNGAGKKCVCVGGMLKRFEHFNFDIFSFFVYVKISPLLLKGKMGGGGLFQNW